MFKTIQKLNILRYSTLVSFVTINFSYCDNSNKKNAQPTQPKSQSLSIFNYFTNKNHHVKQDKVYRMLIFGETGSGK